MVKHKFTPGFQKLFLVIFFLISLFGLNSTAQSKVMNNKLSGDLIAEGDVQFFRLSPDGRHVVFVADAHDDEVNELFSVSTIGGSRITLFSAPSEDLNIYPQITPDSSRVVFLVGSSDRVYDIYTVPITGGSAVRLFGGAHISHGEFDITNDSQNVLFIKSPSHLDHHEIIWRVPINGDAPNTIPQEPCEDCEYEYEVSPDSLSVVYLEWLDPSFNVLYRSDLDGNRDLVTNQVLDYAISPDGNYIVFSQQIPDPNINLYSVPMGRGPAVKLNSDLVDGGQVVGFEITPDSSKVVFRADQTLDEHFLLYAADIGGSDNWPLITIPVPTDVDVITLQITPNSQGVVFKAGPNSDGDNDLYIVSVFGGSPIQLSQDLIDFDYISSVRFTPNSLGVVYLAMMDSGQMELYAAWITGGYETKLNSDLPPGGSVADFRISPDSKGVVFLADQEIDGVKNIYAVPTWGGMEPVQLNSALVEGGEVLGFSITPDSNGVVYRADQEVDGLWELFVTYDYQMVYLPLVVTGN